MLLRQHCGRGKESHLLAAHHRLERRADGDLRLAESHVTANETVHGSRRFHIALRVGDRHELIGSFVERKRILELALPSVVRGKDEARLHLAFRLHAQEFFGVSQHGCLRAGACFLPTPVAQLAQRGISPSDPDVA